MKNFRIAILLMATGCVIAGFIGILLFSNTEQEWGVNKDGFLHYSPSSPQYKLNPLLNDSSLHEAKFASRDMQMDGLLRIPQVMHHEGLPGIVLFLVQLLRKRKNRGWQNIALATPVSPLINVIRG
ncbi:MAG: hypothetical protein LUQ47_01555 [Methanotrichaceae archaeon]|nr:hypothetical protein [Methanotrichaceae archaeon]